MTFDVADDPRLRARLSASGNGLLCSACGHRITDQAQRIEKNGAHEHVFVNPAGMRFRIGCFASADGGRADGEPTLEWTWFGGFRWQVASCGRCGVQVGWRYGNDAGAVFFGLVLDALRDG